MSNKTKSDSPLVRSVLALDTYLNELERVGSRINAADLSEDFDVAYIQKLMTAFGEAGEAVSEEVTQLSRQLVEAQARAEAVAQGVARQAELFLSRSKEHDEKLEQFRVLGEKVRELNVTFSGFRGSEELLRSTNIPGLEEKLSALIEELEALRTSARNSRMNALEKDAASLAQMLQALRTKLADVLRARGETD